MNEELKSRVKRVSERGAYDRDTAYAILDDGFLAHVGISDGAQPYVIPMLYARREDELLLHGSVASRLLQHLADGAAACVTVTHTDGLVLARSAFEHSANYRSVVVLGPMQLIEAEAEKAEAMDHMMRCMIPGRETDARPGNRKELGATTVLRMPIETFSAKVRSGDPEDKEADYALDVWAGVVAFRTVADAPVADARLRAGIEVPEYLQRFVAAPDITRLRSTEKQRR